MAMAMTIVHPDTKICHIPESSMFDLWNEGQDFKFRFPRASIIRSSDVTNVNRKFLHWLVAVVGFNLYFNNWGKVSATPKHLKSTGKSDKKKLFHNQLALLGFLRRVTTNSKEWFSDGIKDISYNVKQIINTRKGYVEKLKSKLKWSFSADGESLLWAHHVMFLSYVAWEASEDETIVGFNEKLMKLCKHDCTLYKGPYLTWQGKYDGFRVFSDDESSEIESEKEGGQDGNQESDKARDPSREKNDDGDSK